MECGTWGETNNLGRLTVYVGSYISKIKTNDLDCHYRAIFVYTPLLEWADLINYLSLEIDYLFCGIDSEWTIPANVFTELAKHPATTLRITCGENPGFVFKGADIINPNASFGLKINISNTTKWNMVDTKLDDVVYMNFAHSGAVPGSFILEIDNESFKEGDILKCYYFNEETKLYEQVKDAKMISDYELQLNIEHCSKYVVSKTEIPAEILAGNNNEGGEGEKDPEQKPTDDKKEEVKQEEIKKEEEKREETKKEDTTKAPGKIPYAGGTTIVVITMLAILVFGIVAYKKNRELKEI